MEHKFWNVAPVVAVVAVAAWYTTGLAFGSTALNILDISDITIFCPSQVKFISQLINSKSRDPQKLLKHFNEPTTSGFNKLLFGVLRIIFVLYSKDLLLAVLLLLIILRLSLISLAESFASSL